MTTRKFIRVNESPEIRRDREKFIRTEDEEFSSTSVEVGEDQLFREIKECVKSN